MFCVTRIARFLPLRLSWFALGAVLAIAFAVGCATNPVSGKKELSFVSESQELAAGQQSKAATEQQYGYYADPKWTAQVSDLGHRLAAVSHRPDLAWEFYLLDDPTVNAFAAPGGFIYITRGILAHLNSEAQLAGVMGHEIGHVTAKHYSKSMTREQLAGAGVGIASIFSKTAAQFGQVAQQGLGLLFLKYGRDEESQADQLGVEYSIKTGYDPRDMPGTYETLARISERAGQRIPSYLSTHPDPAGRAVTVRQLATQQVGARTDLRSNKDGFVRSLDGVVYGRDPRQGYFEGNRFYHPMLKVTIDLPQGWQYQNMRAAVLAGKEDGSAVMRLRLEDAGTLTPGQYVNQLISSKKISGAEGQTEKVNGMDAWLGHVGVQDNQGQQAVLAAAFIRQNAENVYGLLGQMGRGSRDEELFFASARTLKNLTDPARFNVVPARIKIVNAPKTGLFNEIVPTLGAQAIDIEESAILNGVELDDQIQKGKPIKLVTPARVK